MRHSLVETEIWPDENNADEIIEGYSHLTKRVFALQEDRGPPRSLNPVLFTSEGVLGRWENVGREEAGFGRGRGRSGRRLFRKE